ncbi:Peptidase M23 [Turneriella parva DSM 21527]|uniref:Peptidase M23 n=2 Tax=Turneriella TaxID=338321 RepID=I4B1D5_TURPD|nr:Peptidase M23 [Turneriella parva DSM 21527]
MVGTRSQLFTRYFAAFLMATPLVAVGGISDKPDFDDYRRVGRVVQPFSRSSEKKPYGVTLQLRENSIRNLAGGVVYGTGTMRGYGKYIIVDHGKGWHTLYSNVARIHVARGQQLARGSVIGSARSKRLFLVVSYRGNPINPSETIGRSTHEEHAGRALHALAASDETR